MNRRTSTFSLLGAVILALVFVVVYLSQRSVPKINEPLRIGAVLPLTGNLAFIGEGIRNGIEMSKEEFNAAGGIRGRAIEILYEDSKGNATDGLSATQKLVGFDRVQFIIVNLTTVCLAVRPILDQKPVLSFFLSTHPAVLDGSPNGFRVFISGVQESTLLSHYAGSHGYKTFMVLNVSDAYGKGTAYHLKSLLEKFGVVISVQEYNLSSADFRVIATKVKESSPDALVVIGYGREYPLLFRQLGEQGWSGPILGNLSFANLAGQSLQGPLASQISYSAPGYFSAVTRLNSSQNFIDRYKRRYGKDPDFNAAYGYDNVRLLAQALSAVGDSDISRIRAYLLEVRGYEGAIGRVDMTHSGDSETDMQVIDGVVGSK